MDNQIKTKPTQAQLDSLCVNTIRFLSIDAVQKANSGHPGLPMDAAPMGYVLWTKFLRYNPSDPNWFDRDRFILSAGHGSMLLYSLLYLTGYNLSLDQIKSFRQWGSEAPGHPERGETPGVEITTGPLGQGFANGVGMAIAEANLRSRFNRPGFELTNHMTYSIVSDGDLMEGVSSEAASLAGALKLGKIIYLYDSNHITLSGSTNLVYREDVAKRFNAYGWHTAVVEDGNDLNEISQAIENARQVVDQPSLIIVHTHIGYGSPHKQDTFEAHGSPLGPDEVIATKKNLGWPLDPPFYIPDQALEHFREAVPKGKKAQEDWNAMFEAYRQKYPDLAAEFEMMVEEKIPTGWAADLPRFEPDAKGIATRVALGKVMNATAAKLPRLIGGSADLDPSTHTALNGLGDFGEFTGPESEMQGSVGGGWSYGGRNIHFGVREHAMGAIVNGLAAHGGFLPYSATFLIFSDYMRPPMRLASMMHLHVLFIFTHDSVGLGEDGPTHQPVEQLLGLRSIPGMIVIRPADANETAAAWQAAVEQKEAPVTLALSRQNLPILDLKQYPQIPEGVRSGGYILSPVQSDQSPDIILVATGSEVHLVLDAKIRLDQEGIKTRVVSMPSWNLFNKQTAEYRQAVLPPNIPILSVEAGTTLGWRPYFGPAIDAIGVDRFGASAPGEVVFEKYGITVDHVYQQVHELLGRTQKISNNPSRA
jgi:transketolase